MKAWGIYIDGELEPLFGVWGTRRRASKALLDHYKDYDKIPKGTKILGVEIIGNHVDEPAEMRANIATHNAMRIIGFDKYTDDAVLMNSSLFLYYNRIRDCIMGCIEEKEASPEEVAKRENELLARLSNGLVGGWIVDTHREVCCQVRRLDYYEHRYKNIAIYNEDNELALVYTLANVKDLIKHHSFEEVYTDGGYGGWVDAVRYLKKAPNGFSDYKKRDEDLIEESQE